MKAKGIEPPEMVKIQVQITRDQMNWLKGNAYNISAFLREKILHEMVSLTMVG